MRRAIRGLSNDEYHNGEIGKGHVSSSMIKSIAKEGIHAFSERGEFQSNGRSLDFGSAAHAYFFEYDSYFDQVEIFETKLDGRTREGKAQKARMDEINAAGEKILLWPHEQDAIEKMWKNTELVYPTYAHQFRQNQRDSELSFFTDDWRGFKAKVRADHYGESQYGSTIFDLKTTFDNPIPKNVKRESAKYQYDIQDVMYRDVTGADAFIFVYVKTTPPFTVNCYRITNDFVLDAAELQIRYALEKYQEYLDNGGIVPPTYDGKIHGI